MVPDSILAELSQTQLIAATALLLGALVVVTGLAGWFAQAYGRRGAAERPEAAPLPDSASDVRPAGVVHTLPDAAWPLALLVLIVVVGAWLRLDGLDAKTLTHTEAIIPNIVWPPDTWPPTRTSFYDTFWWHFHGEGHPQGHYFFMWAWTKAFGTSLISLRLPSALFGIGSILLVFWLASLTHGRRVAVLAAGLVAFNGLHIYFSQYSRMFMMASFLALLSTILLLQTVHARERRVWWELAYVLVSWLAIYSLTFFWTILAAQMLWLVLQRRAGGGVVQRVLGLQALVVMVGAPSLAHVIYRGDDVTLPGPSLGFIAEYLSFGFAFQPDPLSIPPRRIPFPLAAVILFFAALLAGRGMVATGRNPGIGRSPPRLDQAIPIRWMLLVAAGSALVVVGLTLVALRHQAAMAAVILVPFLAVGLPPVGRLVHARLHGPAGGRGTDAAASALRESRSINTMLAIVPPAIVVALSFWTSMLTSRAFLIFVPFLLILIAAGALTFVRRRALAAGVAGALLAIHVASVAYWKQYPSEQFDYAELARGMAARIQPGDKIFVPPNLWVVTPLYYYLEDGPHVYVTRDYARAVADDPGARVWLLFFDSYQWGSYGTTTDEMLNAVASFRLEEQVEALRARAQLFVKED